MSEKKDRDPLGSPFEWLFHASLLIVGTVIALNVAIASVRPILGWIVAGIIIAAATALVIATIRWNRRKW
jgi:type III secretory pathway component EscV